MELRGLVDAAIRLAFPGLLPAGAIITGEEFRRRVLRHDGGINALVRPSACATVVAAVHVCATVRHHHAGVLGIYPRSGELRSFAL